MSVSDELRLLVRQRADFSCEYCGVTEIDTGGELTVDHYQPPRRGGAEEDLENLLYSCHRCNQYKSDYWPRKAHDPLLWNPRRDQRELHMVSLADGTLYSITPEGAFTIRRLRLNRPPLIAHRLRRYRTAEETRLLVDLREMLSLQEHLQRQHAALLKEQRELLEQQRKLLAMLIDRLS